MFTYTPLLNIQKKYTMGTTESHVCQKNYLTSLFYATFR